MVWIFFGDCLCEIVYCGGKFVLWVVELFE